MNPRREGITYLPDPTGAVDPDQHAFALGAGRGRSRRRTRLTAAASVAAPESAAAVANYQTTVLADLAAPDLAHPSEHRDAAVLLCLPGVGRQIAATMLSEASQAIADRDYHALRAYAGSAPITRQSGKKTVVLMRRGCNDRLRNALYHRSRVLDPRSKETCAQMRARGHSHPGAALHVRPLASRVLHAPSAHPLQSETESRMTSRLPHRDSLSASSRYFIKVGNPLPPKGAGCIAGFIYPLPQEVWPAAGAFISQSGPGEGFSRLGANAPLCLYLGKLN